MKIAQYRDVHYQMRSGDMRSGDVIAFAAKDIFSKMVRWGTQSTVSHVGVVAIDEAAEGIEIVESHPLSFDKGTDKDTDKDTGKLKPGAALTHAEHDRTSFFARSWWQRPFRNWGS
jgi:hypothetical protein